MPDYSPHAGDAAFLLLDVLNATDALARWPALAEHADPELLRQILDEAASFVGGVVAPLNQSGDQIGCVLQDGNVTTPPGFRDAYQAFWQAGWPALSVSPDQGGQGLPTVLEMVLYEWLSGANHGWTMAPGLLHGAYECIKQFAPDAVKAEFLPKVASGEWLATMCLTEPQAGSDLGLATTRAVPLADGRFALSGTKIFISGGEHDLTDNIVHLVLARLPDSPPGPKGLSLFLVPKFYADGRRSAVVCERIEDKMGLHGSPTCVLRFEGAEGWQVGQTGQGLSAMFVMMNAARLHVALQGVGLLDAAWQKADAYARERRQMRVSGPAPASRGAQTSDLLIEHPAMRRILDSQRAWIDGGRLLAYRTSLVLDQMRHDPDAEERSRATRWAAFITPVLKASLTHQAFHGASACLQVFGGHGYVRDSGIEQTVRDARVSMIYEGTNEIQANDLLVRKVLADGGREFSLWLDDLERILATEYAPDAATSARLQRLRECLPPLLAACAQRADLPGWIATDFLRAVSLALLGWAWACIGQRTPAADVAPAVAERWLPPAAAVRAWVLPEFAMALDTLLAQC